MDTRPVDLKLVAPPRRVTAVESIIEQIVALVQDGTLKPGDKLPSERQLMSMLQVSRPTASEALQALVAMDVVEVRVGAGTFVKPLRRQVVLGPDIATLSTNLQRNMRHQVNQAREVLELGLVAIAAEKMNPESAARIEEALQLYLKMDPTNPSEEKWQTHTRLHMSFAEAAGNAVMERMLQSLLELVPGSLRARGFGDGAPEENQAQIETERMIHREICRALIAGDGPAAQKWIEQHARHETEIIDHFYGALEGEATP